MEKALTDCFFFLSGNCTKGTQCEFRHSLAVLNNPAPCKFWTQGGCHNINCRFRHGAKSAATGDKGRSSTPCYWLTQPSGCAKGAACPFSHAAAGTATTTASPPEAASTDASKATDAPSPAPAPGKAPPKVEPPSLTAKFSKAAPKQAAAGQGDQPPKKVVVVKKADVKGKPPQNGSERQEKETKRTRDAEQPQSSTQPQPTKRQKQQAKGLSEQKKDDKPSAPVKFGVKSLNEILGPNGGAPSTTPALTPQPAKGASKASAASALATAKPKQPPQPPNLTPTPTPKAVPAPGTPTSLKRNASGAPAPSAATAVTAAPASTEPATDPSKRLKLSESVGGIIENDDASLLEFEGDDFKDLKDLGVDIDVNGDLGDFDGDLEGEDDL